MRLTGGRKTPVTPTNEQMNANELTADEIAQHANHVVETLDEEWDRIEKELGRGVAEVVNADETALLATPDYDADGETYLFVRVCPEVGGGIGHVAVTDFFQHEDFAWEGIEGDLSTLQSLVDEGHLVVVEECPALFVD